MTTKTKPTNAELDAYFLGFYPNAGYEPERLPKLKPSVKKRWVEALRSGKYTQGVGELKTAGGSFCCLGVLCDVVKDDALVKGEWQVDAYGSRNFAVDGDFSSTEPPHTVDVRAINARSITRGDWSWSPLIARNDFNNDDYAFTFDVIADIIEEHC